MELGHCAHRTGRSTYSLVEGVSEGRPERLGKFSVEAEAGGGMSNNEGDWVDTKSLAYKHWDWNWKKGFVTVRATIVHKMWSWGLPLDARRQAPLCEIGEILKDPQNVKLRSPDGPHDVQSLAVPQHMSTRTTMNTDSLCANTPQDAKLRN